MKNPLLILLLARLTLFAPTIVVQGPISKPLPASSATLNTSLVAYWKLEEASGTRIDSEPGGTPQSLDETNSVTQTTGIIGNAAFFTAANIESLTHIDSTDLSVGDIDFSMAGWAKFTATNTTQTICSHYGTFTANRSWRVILLGSTAQIQFRVTSNGTTETTLTASSFGPVSPDTWVFVVASHDSVNNLLKVSVRSSANQTGTVDSVSYSAGVFNSTYLFQVGNTEGGGPMDGAIDELGFWKKVLSADEITELWNSGIGKTCCPL